MHDAGKVLAGLVVFLAVATSPVWYLALSGADTEPPVFKPKSARQQCIAPTPYIRAFHMDMLNDWREEAVRTTDTTYVGLDGTVYQKSLEGTCLGDCHPKRQEFCDRCHEYVGAEPYCWDCHGPPSGAL